MNDYVGKKMIADTKIADGGVYFREDYLEWIPRHAYSSDPRCFKVRYDEIHDIQVVPAGRKRRIDIITSSKTYSIYMHRDPVFLEIIRSAREGKKNKVPLIGEEPIFTQNDLIRLDYLAQLLKDGVITEEQFKTEKQKIIDVALSSR